jgi:hypothetical protein
MQFLTTITSNIDLNIGYDKRIPNNTYSKFLGIMTDNKLTWKTYSNEKIKIKFSLLCSHSY